MEFNSLSRALNTRLWMTLKSMVRITHFVVTRVTVCVCKGGSEAQVVTSSNEEQQETSGFIFPTLQ